MPQTTEKTQSRDQMYSDLVNIMRLLREDNAINTYQAANKVLDMIDSKVAHQSSECERRVEEAVKAERKRIKEVLTHPIDKETMLEGWQKYWKHVGDERYVENCMECQNSEKIITALTQPNEEVRK